MSPLGVIGDGKTYRANSDDVAVAVAGAVSAAKLLFITSRMVCVTTMD